MKNLQATVINVLDDKTVKVEVERRWKHPKYQKFVKRTRNFLADVPVGIKLEVGQQVEIKACRPLSKLKTFAVVESNQK